MTKPCLRNEHTLLSSWKLFNCLPLSRLIILLLCCLSISLKGQEIIFNSNSPDKYPADNLEFSPGLITDSIGCNDKQATVLTKDSPYGLTLAFSSLAGGKSYELSLMRHQMNPDANLIVVASWNSYYKVVDLISNQMNEWDQLAWIITPPDSCNNCWIKAYGFNYHGKRSLMDDLIVKRLPSNSVPLPLYMISSLYYDLVNDYSIKNQKILSYSEIKQMEIDYSCLEILKIHSSNWEQFLASLDHYEREIGKKALEDQIRKLHSGIIKRTELHPRTADMLKKSCAAFLEKTIVFDDEKAILHLENPKKGRSIKLYSIEDLYQFNAQLELPLDPDSIQELDLGMLPGGFYKMEVSDAQCRFPIPLIKQDKSKGGVAILAPLTTWHAYNAYGGKSLYKNSIDLKQTHYISTQRPLSAVHFDSTISGHDIHILRQLYTWFDERYGATIYPDYYLESNPELFEPFETIILAQHCEYFSTEMYSQLKKIGLTKNILSLGGNQIYWKIDWHDDFKTIECRKDRSYFDSTLSAGMHWRNNWYGEAHLLGVEYTHAGLGSYDAYRKTNPDHWLYERSENDNSLFGNKGLDGRGISGDETDETKPYSHPDTELIARGINRGNGGGEMVLIDKGSHGVLSCGSIACSAGIGIDPTFTLIIENFMTKYHPLE